MKLRQRIIMFSMIMALLLSIGSAQASSKTLTLPASLSIIEEQAFYGVKSISKVEVPEGLYEIQSKAFANSTLTEINLPESIEYIADDAFTGSRLSTVKAVAGSYSYNWAVNHGYSVVSLSPIISSITTSNGTVITIKWGAVQSASGYYAEYSTDNFASDSYVSRYTEDTEFTFGGLKASTKYYIRVYAINSETWNLYSSEIKTKTTGTITKQIPITSLSLYGDSGNSVWMGNGSVGRKDEDAANNVVIEPLTATNYQLNWTSSNTQVATVNKTTGVVTGVSVGVAKITAKATDGSGVSISGDYFVGPVAPTGVKVSASGTTLTVTWNAAQGAECYSVNVYAQDIDDHIYLDNITGTRKCVIKNLASNTEYFVNVASGADVGGDYGIIYGNSADTVSAQTGYSSASVPVREIWFNEGYIELEPGQTYAAATNVNVLPNYANNKKVTWKSDDTSIATVNSSTGDVTAVAGGLANITATAADGSGISGSFTVEVIDNSDPALTLSDEYWLIYTPAAATKTITVSSERSWTASSSASWLTASCSGSTLTLKATKNSTGSERTAVVTVSNNATSKEVRVVQSELAQGPSIETALFQGTTESSPAVISEQSYTVNVGKARSDDPYIYVRMYRLVNGAWTKAGTSLYSGSSFTISPTNSQYNIISAGNSYKFVVWEHSQTEWQYSGNAGIKWNELPTARCTTFYVKVNANPVLVTKITLNKTSTTLTVGGTETLTATVSPSNATNKSVTWSSSNTSVATVTSTGKVTAKAAGTATITVMAADGSGKKATCVVTVISTAPPVVRNSVTNETYTAKSIVEYSRNNGGFNLNYSSTNGSGKYHITAIIINETPLFDDSEYASNQKNSDQTVKILYDDDTASTSMPFALADLQLGSYLKIAVGAYSTSNTGTTADAWTVFGIKLIDNQPIPVPSDTETYYAGRIWAYLKEWGFTDIQAAGIMGNIDAESAYCPYNAENSYGFPGVDNRTDYIFKDDDAVGFGICQWTTKNRKSGLKSSAENGGWTVWDFDAQMNYLLWELNTNYYNNQTWMTYFKSQTTIREAAVAWMKVFENPSDQSPSAQDYRTSLAQTAYDTYAGEYDSFVVKEGSTTIIADGGTHGSFACDSKAGKGAQATFTITSNNTWTVNASDTTWMSVSKTNSTTAIVTIGAVQDGASYSSTLTFTANGKNYTVIVTLAKPAAVPVFTVDLHDMTVRIGDAPIINASVSISGGSGYVGKVTMAAYGHSGSTMSDDFSAHKLSTITTGGYAAYRIDTSKAPWNTPGTYTIRLWATDSNGKAPTTGFIDADKAIASMTLTIKEKTSGYDGEAAAAYAQEHVRTRASSVYSDSYGWTDPSTDTSSTLYKTGLLETEKLCAEFVSDCLAVGGIAIPNQWDYFDRTYSRYIGGKLEDNRDPYINAPAMLAWFDKEGYRIIANPSNSQMEIGDVVFQKGNPPNADGHVVIISGFSTSGVPLYCGHNNHRLNRPISGATYLIKLSQ